MLHSMLYTAAEHMTCAAMHCLWSNINLNHAGAHAGCCVHFVAEALEAACVPKLIC